MENHLPESSQTQAPVAEGFVPPRHWIGPEQLEAKYWADPAQREKRGQEFFEKPVELIDRIDRTDSEGLARRDFLTIMGASMAMASFACARRPVHKIIPYVVKPEEITPGVATYYASTCKDDSSGVLVKTREGRPIKLEGNPDHPISKGALSARAQASILNLYDPDRLQAPAARGARGAASHAAKWEEVDAAIVAKLKAARSVRVLSEPVQGESTLRLVREFLSGFSSASLVEYDLLAMDETAEAQALSYGSETLPGYRFDLADVIVSLSADFIGTWPSAELNQAAWSKNRKLDGRKAAEAHLSKTFCFESTMTLTGANADERFPVRPGDELKIALAIANELFLVQKVSRYAGDGAVSAAVAKYSAETVATEIGLFGGADSIRKTARELWHARGRGLVVAGGIHAKTKDALALQVVTNLLNSALDNEGVTVDGTSAFQAFRGGFAAVNKLIAEMKAGQVDVLIVNRANLAYLLPRGISGFEDALAKVPTVIMISDREDETGLLADFVLPDHHYLEGWGDANPRNGLISLQQPAIAPIHSTRAFEDSLLTWIRMGSRSSGLASRIAASASGNTWHDYLKANWKETVFPQVGAAGSFEQFWEGALRAGVVDLKGAKGLSNAKPSARAFRTASLSVVPAYTPAANGSEMYLALYASNAMYDGRYANNAWLQELPDPISSITWDNYLNVGTEAAARLAVRRDDVVEVTVNGSSVELPVNVQPGMHPNAISVAVGYGRRAVGKVGNQAGVNVYPLMRMDGSRLVLSGDAVKLRKTQRFYRLAATQWHTATESRPIINDVTFAEFKKNPGVAAHSDPELRMEKVPSIWPEHEYKGYRWGMVIDLNSCTGCSACMIGCQAENNIPVVGRDQVRNSRQMHWIRIDRYYSGSPQNPDVVFQPMLCQHCANAPCETVCPVLATVHDDEGLNIQAYNRCVGTRYCQNNCPYKVRRFNFFDHWKSYEGTMSMVWNPDVTVRSRGIMEKCTFCTQRILEAKGVAKDKGEKVADGAFKTACQQTCPTDAIVFGDMNDPETRVSKLMKDPRAFRVIEVLNTKPSISYMTKVRNKEKAAGGHTPTGSGAAHHS